MLFNSFEFLCLFLPVLLVIFFTLGKYSRRLAASWLTVGSLFFYGYWNPVYMGLLLGSILFNYMIGYGLTKETRHRKTLLMVGIACDLLLLAYYKYANFFIANLNSVLDLKFGITEIVLPLGISFFTFTQIAFLVDAFRREAKEFDFVHYALFVTYFPHLIAGPVLHHKEMMPQFGQPSTYRLNQNFIVIGLTIFALGLFKKVVIADSVLPYVSPVFSAADKGETLMFFQAWGGALAYTFQLYFDFSGYSDMAVGLSYMIGVKLPINFNSPYKAVNIADFWRRWHMTLSRFLRDYLYIPLGGNRKGPVRRYMNLLITMLLGGLWHGAGWSFVVWGGLHGFYLVMHQGWLALRQYLGWHHSSRVANAFAVLLTFFMVVIAWVFFRASSFESALVILKGMSGVSGVSLPSAFLPLIGETSNWLQHQGIVFTPGGGKEFVLNYLWILALLPVVFFAPNTHEIMRKFPPALAPIENTINFPSLVWEPSRRWAVIMALVSVAGLLSLMKPSEFLYFQF